MKALILAAGTNTRLKEICRDYPKCLLKVGNFTIIEHQLNLLNSLGIDSKDIYVIGGYRFEKLENSLKGTGVNLIYNPKFREFNNIYSFYLGGKIIRDDFILFNGDTLVHKKILESLMKSEHKTAFVVDNVKKLGVEEMKVIIKDDKIARFGKEINPRIADGEYIGLAKFSLEDALLILDETERLLNKGKINLWYEEAINQALDKVDAFAVYTNGLPWIEIDTPEDFETAKKVYHKIFSERL